MRPALFTLAALTNLSSLACMGTDDALYTPAEQAPFFVTNTVPAAGASGIPTDVVVDIGLSDVPYPGDLPGAWRMRTGGLGVTGKAIADLPDRRVRIRAARGLLPFLQYTVTLTPSLHSFDGTPLGADSAIAFVTDDGPAGPPPAGPVRSLRADVLPAFTRSGCATNSCHGGPAPSRSLDLASPGGLLAIGARRALTEPDQFLLTPGAHATSYLMWKGMGLPRTQGHRLPVLSHDDARALADWIDQGVRDN